MGSLERTLRRNKEKKELQKMRELYNKKPKQKCPKCNKNSLFYTNKDGETFCLRCDNVVKISRTHTNN